MTGVRVMEYPIGIKQLKKIWESFRGRANMSKETQDLMNKILFEMFSEKPLIFKSNDPSSEFTKLIELVRSKMGSRARSRMNLVLDLLGDTPEKRETKFKRLPWHIRTAFKAFIWVSSALEYLINGAYELYEQTVEWLEKMVGSRAFQLIGKDFNIPKEIPDMDQVIDLIYKQGVYEAELANYLDR